MYADKRSEAMELAIGETERRRAIQLAYNREHGITPTTIAKGVSDIGEFLQGESKLPKGKRRRKKQEETDKLSLEELNQRFVALEEEMLAAAEDLRFEHAAALRDELRELRQEIERREAA